MSGFHLSLSPRGAPCQALGKAVNRFDEKVNMNNETMAGKSKIVQIFKIASFIFLMVVLVYGVHYIRLQIMFSADVCESEKKQAERSFLNSGAYHVPLSTLLIDSEDLPSDLPVESDVNISQLDSESNLFPLKSGKTVYTIMVNGEKRLIEHDVYWFGSDSYSYCRYRELTVWELVDKPNNLKWSSNRLVGLDVIDSVNCYRRNGQEASSCVWVGKYGGYVTSFFTPIGQNAISFEEFNSIIIKIDQRMREYILGN